MLVTVCSHSRSKRTQIELALLMPIQTKQTLLSRKEKLERKQRVLTHGTSSVTTGIADAVVVKSENVFLLTQQDGSVPLADGHGYGLYCDDCCYLSGYEFQLAGSPLNPLSLES